MIHTFAARLHAAVDRRVRAIRALLEAEGGQGTVEYVGLILLVSLLMVGMVAAMKGFNGKQGTELADVIVGKIRQAVNAITYRWALGQGPSPAATARLERAGRAGGGRPTWSDAQTPGQTSLTSWVPSAVPLDLPGSAPRDMVGGASSHRK
jgi:hypothetical protein